MTPDDELELLRQTFQRCIDDKNPLTAKSAEFTVDGAAWYRVTPGQRAALMSMAPERIRALNTGDRSPAALVADHLAECTDAKAAIVVDGNADDVIADLIAAGWTLQDGTEVIAGKRIRIMSPPPGVAIRALNEGATP